MDSDEYLESMKLGYREVKDQYKIYLGEFDDIKKKSQILLLICSFIITVPLANDIIFKSISSSVNLLIIFLSGIICLIITIFLLIVALMDSEVRIPYFFDVFKSIGKYPVSGIFKSLIRGYGTDLSINLKNREAKRRLVGFAERFICSGIILIMIALITVLIKGV